MGIPILELFSPIDNSSVISLTPTLSVNYEDPVDNHVADVTVELDRVGTFNTEDYQTQTIINTLSGERVDFNIATPVYNGYWYWRISATNIDGTTISEILTFRVDGGDLKRTLYHYENVGKFLAWNKKRTLYHYENVSKFPEWNKKRNLYQYENLTDEAPFPYIEYLSATKVETGSSVLITGNGFGSNRDVDTTNGDRSLRGYGGLVYIGDTLASIISWSWTEIEILIPDTAESGALKVVLTSPDIRESNVIGIEVVQKFADATGLELYVCDRLNPNTIIAYLEGARGKSFQSLLNEPGSGSLTISRYDLKGGNRDLIKDQNLILCKIGGRSIFKWIIESRNPQYVNSAETQEIKISGRGVMSILDTAVVYPEGMPTPGSLEREFVDMRGAAILRQLILEAKTRGALVGIDMDFTADEDAIGNPWTDMTSISFHAGTPLIEVARKLGEGLGLFDYEMTPDLQFKLYKTKGTNKYEEIKYRPSQAIITHQNKSDASKVVNTVLVEGEGGAIVEAVHADGQNTWGRREGYLQARNIKGEWSALQSYGNSYLATSAYSAWGIQGSVSEFVGSTGERLAPFKSYDLGDWIGWVIPPEGSDDVGFDGKLRVKGITCREDNETGNLSYTLELNNVMLEHEIKIAQLVDRMAQFSRSTTLTSPSTQVNAPISHNHVHGLLSELSGDDHPQYLNVERHAADLHESIQRVSGISAAGESVITGEVKLISGENISILQNTENKEITIASTSVGLRTGEAKQWIYNYSGKPTISTSSYNAKGGAFKPSNNVIIHGLGFVIDADSVGKSMTFGIYEVDESNKIINIMVESQEVTVATGISTYYTEFLTSIEFEAEKRYTALAFYNDGSNIKIGASSHTYDQATGLIGYANIASVPLIGSTLSNFTNDLNSYTVALKIEI